MDAVSDNIANLNTVRPTSQSAFQARYVSRQLDRGRRHPARARQVAGVAYGSATGRLVYDPSNPLADTKGYVRYPDIDLVLADDPADHGPARLPGEPRRGRPGHATPTPPRSSSGVTHERHRPAIGVGRRCLPAPPSAASPASARAPTGRHRRDRRQRRTSFANVLGQGLDSLQSTQAHGRQPVGPGGHRHAARTRTT